MTTTTSVHPGQVVHGDLLHWQNDKLAVAGVRVLIHGRVVRTGERHLLQYDLDEYVTVTRAEG